MHWSFNSQPLTQIPLFQSGKKLIPAIGFIYHITNTQTNKHYIGKKLFHHKRNKKTIESDWQSYNGSNKTLLEEIKSNNPILIKNILHICHSKSQCNYIEAYYQFKYNVLLSPDYYNDWISVRVTKKQLQKYATIIESELENSKK